MKGQKFKRIVLTICACCVLVAAGIISASAEGTDTIVLERNASYVRGNSISGYEAGFTGSNDETSEKEVQFSAFYIDKGGKKTRFVYEVIQPGGTLSLQPTDRFPDLHTFYGDLDVPWAYTHCYAVANLYVC